MEYPLELHVTAPEGTSPQLVLSAVAAATTEYLNVWGDHFTVSFSIKARCVVPMVDNPDDNPETPLAHVWVVFVPND